MRKRISFESKMNWICDELMYTSLKKEFFPNFLCYLGRLIIEQAQIIVDVFLLAYLFSNTYTNYTYVHVRSLQMLRSFDLPIRNKNFTNWPIKKCFTVLVALSRSPYPPSRSAVCQKWRSSRRNSWWSLEILGNRQLPKR